MPSEIHSPPRLASPRESAFSGQNRNQRIELRRCLPPEQPEALFRITAAVGDLGGAEERGIDVDVIVPVEVVLREGGGGELFERVAFAGGDDEVLGLILLEHAPHRFDVFGGVAPVAGDVEEAEGGAAA